MLKLNRNVVKKVGKTIRRIFKPPNWLNLRSTKPISSIFGLDRGTPIDRFYIDHFLSTNKQLIRGIVCEIAEDTYIRKYGSNVKRYEILHYTNDNTNATIVGDLTNLETLPKNSIDCFVCTQTLNFIYDFEAAIEGIHHVLKIGGVAMVTVAGISQISRYDMDRWGDYWRFTKLSLQKAFDKVFTGEGSVQVDHYGNVLASVAFLEGIVAEELTVLELMTKDQDYQLLLTVIAKK